MVKATRQGIARTHKRQQCAPSQPAKRLTPRQMDALLRRSEPDLSTLIRDYYTALQARNTATRKLERFTSGTPVEYRVSGMWSAIRRQMTITAEEVIKGHRAAWDRGEGRTPVSRWHVSELESIVRAIKRRCEAGERRTTKNCRRPRKLKLANDVGAATDAVTMVLRKIREYKATTAIGLQTQLLYVQDCDNCRLTAIEGLRRLIETEKGGGA